MTLLETIISANRTLNNHGLHAAVDFFRGPKLVIRTISSNEVIFSRTLNLPNFNLRGQLYIALYEREVYNISTVLHAFIIGFLHGQIRVLTGENNETKDAYNAIKNSY